MSSPSVSDERDERSAARAAHERAHGAWLAAATPETIWGWGTPAGRQRAERRAGWITESAGLAQGVLALEIGCGTGLFTGLFARSQARIVAVDISADLLAAARARGLPQDRVTFVEARFEDLGSSGTYDAIIGSSVLHHLDLLPALRTAYRLLKPGGRVAFAEPNMINPLVFVQKKVPVIKRLMGDSPDETAFVRWGLASRMHQVGFRQIEVVPRDWLHPATPPSWIAGLTWIEARLERTPGVKELAGSLYICGTRPHMPD